MADGFEFEINGRKVSRDQFFGESGLQGLIIQRVVDEMATKLRDIRCGTHGVGPTVTVVRSGEDAQFKISGGCCDALKGDVERFLSEHGGQPPDAGENENLQ